VEKLVCDAGTGTVPVLLLIADALPKEFVAVTRQDIVEVASLLTTV
jgi:hypothetical protein